MAVVPDDKMKHLHWIMSVETCEALLATYYCTSEHWSFSHMTKQEASNCIEEIMIENLPERWKHEFSLKSQDTKLAAVLVLHRQVQVLQNRRTSV